MKLENNKGASVCATNGAQLTVPESAKPLEEFLSTWTLHTKGSTYFEIPPVSGVKLRVVTPSAIITETGTQFEVLVDDTGTWVRAFSGSVQVTDVARASTYTVNVGAGETISVPKGGYPYSATLFDSSTAERWWETLSSSTPAPGGFDVSSFLVFPPLLIATVAAVVIIIVVVGVSLSRRRKTTSR